MTRRTPGWGLNFYLHEDDVAVWLRGVLARLVPAGNEMPLDGSAAWHAAPDPVRLASALRAGEAWRRDGLYVVDDIVTEQAAQAEVEAQEWAELGAQVRRMADTPTHDELAARRIEVVRRAAGAA